MFARKSGLKLLLVVVGTLVLAGSFYAFAAANTVTAPNSAGIGSGVISGYDVTGINYSLDISNTGVLSVTFGLAPIDDALPAAWAQVKISDVGNIWYDCDVAGGSADCDLTLGGAGPVVTTENLTLLKVAAASVAPTTHATAETP